MQPSTQFEKYEIVGLYDGYVGFIRYLKKKYPNYETELYGSHLLGLFIRGEISKEEYIRLIKTDEWISEEMTAFGPGWGSKWLITNVDTPVIADEIKKAGGLLIYCEPTDHLYDDPAPIADYKGFDVRLCYSYDPNLNDEMMYERLVNEINQCLVT